MTAGYRLQRAAAAGSVGQASVLGRGACYALVAAALVGANSSCPAQPAADRASPSLQEVVIQAGRLADEQITREVEKTLAADPWIFGDHITVTTRNGVVRVEGIVGDTGEMFRIVRLCRRIPGTRRVVNGLEMMHNDPDGG